jgi:hypothetical protein
MGVPSEVSCACAQAPQRTWKMRQASKRNLIRHICFQANTASGMGVSQKRSASASRCCLARLRARLLSAFAYTAPCSSHAPLLKVSHLPCYPFGTSKLLLDLWECNRYEFTALPVWRWRRRRDDNSWLRGWRVRRPPVSVFDSVEPVDNRRSKARVLGA